MIARHHLDFVLCDHGTTNIRLGIELDDRSHDKAIRKKRDMFVNEALAAAGIPLLRIQAAARYESDYIEHVLLSALGLQSSEESH
jgi:very-short-patch-repair endonuclease